MLGAPEWLADALPHQCDRMSNLPALAEPANARASARSVREWTAALEAEGVPADRSIPSPRWRPIRRALAREMVVELDHPRAGATRALGLPIKLSATPGSRRPAPPRSAHARGAGNTAFPPARSKSWSVWGPQSRPDIIGIRESMRRSIKFVAAGLALALAGLVQAQSWPNKPMVFLNPFAGGGTDCCPADRGPPGPDARRTGPGREPGRGGGHGRRPTRPSACRTGTTGSWRSAPYHRREPVHPAFVQPGEGFRAHHHRAFVPNVVVVHPKHADKFKTLRT